MSLKEGHCYECDIDFDLTTKFRSPYFCPDCDQKRINKISRQLEDIVDSNSAVEEES